MHYLLSDLVMTFSANGNGDETLVQTLVCKVTTPFNVDEGLMFVVRESEEEAASVSLEGDTRDTGMTTGWQVAAECDWVRDSRVSEWEIHSS